MYSVCPIRSNKDLRLILSTFYLYITFQDRQGKIRKINIKVFNNNNVRDLYLVNDSFILFSFQSISVKLLTNSKAQMLDFVGYPYLCVQYIFNGFALHLFMV